MLYDISLITFLLLLSGILSSSETALLSFKTFDLEGVSSLNLKKALKYWLKKPNDILSTILVCGNFINILISAITTGLIAKRYTGDSIVAISTVVSTVIIIIFGEITPKLIGKNYAYTVSKLVIIPLTMISQILYPIVFILTQISKFIARIIGLKIIDKDISTVTEKDIRSIISVGGDEGIIAQEKQEMLNGVLDFSDLTVGDLVVPRQDVFMLQASSKLKDVLGLMAEKGFSRVPVYETNFDNIIGAIYMKDLITVLKDGDLDRSVKLFMRDITFVPETKNALSLLKDFKDQKIHIAVVVDEYGGTVGIITINDVLEQIVGDIKDEFDKPEIDVKKLDDNKFLIKASLDIDEINDLTDLNIPESEEYDSLGGFITYLIGRVPQKGEVVNWNNLELLVKEVDNHAVKYSIVTKMTQEEEEQEVDVEN